MKLRLNKEKKEAFELIEKTNSNVFLTGRAGSGKSTLLKFLKEKTKKKTVVLAPTGIAAINVGGQTIHSFFGFGTDITPEKARNKIDFRRRFFIESLERIIFDETSMIRADLLDSVDANLRANKKKDLPFGGVQMVFMGDLYQLPPVVTEADKEWFFKIYDSPYFFSANSFRSIDVKYVALEKVFRQKEKSLIKILNAIRLGETKPNDLAVLNAHVKPFSSPDEMEGTVYLTTTNNLADRINAEQLAKLPGKTFVLNGLTMGDFPETSFPSPRILYLKEGAQVMMVNNDSLGLWVNGDIGKIISIKEASGIYSIRVDMPGRGQYDLYQHQWDLVEFKFNEKEKRVETAVRGSYRQYPLKLAWAVTIHKSQGKTFDKVVIDLGRGAFAPGQTYVALSRCTSLDGLTLRRPITSADIFTDEKIAEFTKKMEEKQ